MNSTNWLCDAQVENITSADYPVWRVNTVPISHTITVSIS